MSLRWGPPSASVIWDNNIRVYSVGGPNTTICEWASSNNGASWSVPNCNLDGNYGFKAQYGTTVTAVRQFSPENEGIYVFFQSPEGGAYYITTNGGSPADTVWRFVKGLP